MCVSLVCQGCLKVVPKVLCLKGVRRMLQINLSGCWVFQEGFKDVSWLFQNYFNCVFSVFQGNDKLELSRAVPSSASSSYLLARGIYSSMILRGRGGVVINQNIWAKMGRKTGTLGHFFTFSLKGG